MTTDDNNNTKQTAGSRLEEQRQAVEKMRARFAELAEDAAKAIEAGKLLYNSDAVRTAREASEYLATNWQELQKAAAEWLEVAAELDDELQKPKYGGRSFDELLELDDGDDPHGLAAQAWEAAKRAVKERKEAERKKDLQERQKDFSKVKYNNAEVFRFITDKLIKDFHSNIVQAEAADHIDRALRGDLLTSSGNSLKYEGEGKPPITLYYDFSIDGARLDTFGITPRFSYFDLFVVTVLDNLYLAGNTKVTLTKIWHELGNEGRPNSRQLTEIFKSIVRSEATTCLGNIPEVAEHWTKKAPIDGRLSMRRLTNVDFTGIPYKNNNGKLQIKGNGGTITIRGLSLFYDLAEQLNHITQYDGKFLRLYAGTRTDLFYGVLFYLVHEISWMRYGGRSNKITYKELYKVTGADTATNARRERAKARKMASDILQQMFIPAGYITTVEESKTGQAGFNLTYTKD